MVQTDERKAFIHQYEKTYDVHAVYCKLVNFVTRSKVAELSKCSLIKYLTMIKLDSRWSGTTVGFILHWCEQIRHLDDMSSDAEQFSASVRMQMLESAVESIPELANIKEIDTNRVANGRQPMTFAQYKDTLLLAATRHDERIKPTSLRNKCIVQATITKYGDNDKDCFKQGYLDAGEDYITTSINETSFDHHKDQRRPPNKDSSGICKSGPS